MPFSIFPKTTKFARQTRLCADRANQARRTTILTHDAVDDASACADASKLAVAQPIEDRIDTRTCVVDTDVDDVAPDSAAEVHRSPPLSFFKKRSSQLPRVQCLLLFMFMVIKLLCYRSNAPVQRRRRNLHN